MELSHEPSSAKRPASADETRSTRAGADPAVERGDPQFRSGLIELRSGRWKWTAHVSEKGSAIVFHNDASPNNRMRAWLPDSVATEADVLRAGREPELRWWEDPVTRIWEIRVEETSFPSRLEQRARPRQRIVFEGNGNRVGTELPEGRTLGELTSAELTALLYEAD